MCKVAKCFNEDNIATLSQQLSYSHLIELSSIENEIKRDFFTQLCIYERWGVREVREKADTMLFERTAIAEKPKETIKEALQKLKEEKIVSPELVFKNSYVLDFLNLPANYSEQVLENALINNLQQFIMELGSGFAKLKNEAIGAVFAALVTKDFESQILIKPDKNSIKEFGEKTKPIYDFILNIGFQNQKLSVLKDLLLSKLATIEN